MNPRAPHPFRPAEARCRGVALVLVLASLVLIAGIVIAFLKLAGTERANSASFLAATNSRQMSDAVVALVQTQINHATTTPSGSTTRAWASQPGMIRTYKTAGALDTAYKLYSAQTLTESNPVNIGPGSIDVPPTDWASNPAVWNDLNAPVTVNGILNYPILDGGLAAGTSTNPPSGFSISGAPGATVAQPAPMPVRWLYLLANGSFVAPSVSGSSVTVAGATADNPIVGRVAFWTDDDSTKVNLNTAGVNGYWDPPRFDNIADRKLATSQPVRGEFQRYPGHPATTNLTAVFPGLTDQQVLETVTPRYLWGGSNQGATDTFTSTTALNNGTVKSAPLYTTTDELAYMPSNTARSKNGNLTDKSINERRFFLTTNSRSPEVNLFNLPRVSCWPIATDPTGRTAFDNVIAYCATIGDQPYYFQRQNALSATADTTIARNQILFTYLQSLAGRTIPGFGVDLVQKFGADTDQIFTEIWDYIRCTNLFDTRLPGAKRFAVGEDGNKGNGWGYVVPLRRADNRGFGRAITLTELAFAFICTADPVDTANPSSPDADGLLSSNAITGANTNRTLGGVKLSANQRRIQMMLIPELFSPSQGNVGMRPRFVRFRIEGLNTLTLNGIPLFPTAQGELILNQARFNSGWHARYLGGPFDYRALIGDRISTSIPGDTGGSGRTYPFISNFVTVPVPNPGNLADPGTMNFAAGALTVTFETSLNGTTWTADQVLNIDPNTGVGGIPIPIPNLVTTGTAARPTSASTQGTSAHDWWAFTRTAGARSGSTGRLIMGNGISPMGEPGFFRITAGVPRGDGPIIGSLPNAITDSVFAGTLLREATDLPSPTHYTDVVRSLVPIHGDFRLLAGLSVVPKQAWTLLGPWSATGSANALIHNLAPGATDALYIPGGSQFRRHMITTNPIGRTSPSRGSGGQSAPDFPNLSTSADSAAGQKVLDALLLAGDFDSPTAFWQDGAFINKPDEGNVLPTAAAIPYYLNSEQEDLRSEAFFSPNRMTPGPGMFGSLPTHIKRYEADPGNPENYAWRTLLFRRQPGHPNAVSFDASNLPSQMPDHLLMDLFWMPTVEPYAISEPFATAGKINMNYQIQPFTYIKRATGLHAVLDREKVPAVNNAENTRYKDGGNGRADRANNTANYRLDIDVDETLSQFETRFANPSGRIFISPTEFCDLWIVPKGETVSGMATFWNSHQLTGDNMRERPYTRIVPRLTTKSNTFTVHFRVQALKTPAQAGAANWNEARGTITGEYRGSTTIERFIDLADPALAATDFATNAANAPSLDSFYRWRVLSNRQFSP